MILSWHVSVKDFVGFGLFHALTISCLHGGSVRKSLDLRIATINSSPTILGEGERETDRPDRQTDRDTQRDRDTERLTERERDRQTDRQTETGRQAGRQAGRDRDTETDREKKRLTDRQADTQTDRHTDRQREVATGGSESVTLLFCLLYFFYCWRKVGS